MNCPLCNKLNTSIFYQEKIRYFLRCEACHLVYLEQNFWPTAEEEKKTYDLHENSPQDQGYRKFLSRMMDPLIQKIPANSKGLDFGCGNGPTLSVMLEELGHKVSLFDKFYENHPEVLLNDYDFIVCTEVIEHLSQPKKELVKLLEILKPNGVLGIMTKLAKEREDFSNWHYKHDPTHICFYSIETFNWIAREYGLEVEFVGNDVIFS